MTVRRVLGLVVAVAGLVLAQRVLDPAPIPAGGLLIGGLIPLALGRSRRPVALGAAIGCVVGALVHAYSHVREGRAAAPLETAGHVLADAGYGALVGGVLLLVAWLVSREGS